MTDQQQHGGAPAAPQPPVADWVYPTYTDQPAGDLDGYPMTARFCNGQFYQLACACDGVAIATDGRDYVNLPASGTCDGDMTIAEWAQLKRLAATDIVERLIARALGFDLYAAREVGK